MFLERARTIAILCLTVFGCTGNILTFIVVNQPFFRKTTSASPISALCIADCMVLCLQSFQIVAKLRPHVTSYDCVLFFLIDVFRLLSVWIVCFINIERCSLVFNPCRLPRLTSRTKSRVAMCILFLISLLIFSHYARHTRIQYVYNVNQTIPLRSFCAFKQNFDRLTWGCIRSGLTYWSVVPLCIICNLIIVQRLRQASRIERKLNENNNKDSARPSIQLKVKFDLSSKQRQLTAMLVASSIGFVLTATPSTIHATYLLITNRLNNFHYVIHTVTNILLHFHHASNFLAFSLSNTRFRIELLQFFRRYLHCQMYINWYKRSLPATEQHFLNSTKQQQKMPVRLLSSKSRSPNQAQLLQQRSIQPYYLNGVVPRGRDYYRQSAGQNVIQPFL